MATQKSRGVVAIFGWMFSKPRHLNKIADWWSARGFTPKTLTGAPEVLYFPMKNGRETGTRMAKEIAELDKVTHADGSKPPVFFHVFSGQGAATLAHTLHELSPQQKMRVGGIVLDSAAAKMDIDQATLGFKSAFHARPWLGEILGPPFWLVGKGIDLVNPALSRWAREYHALILESCPRWQVFHSKSDPYVPHELMTELIQKKRETGGDVNYKLWESGAHVGLFRDHHDEYSDLLEAFVTKCEEEYREEVSVAEQEGAGCAKEDAHVEVN